MFSDFKTFFLDIALPQIVYWLEFFAVLWIPAILIPVAWGFWVRYTRRDWLSKQKFAVLEIKLPQETFKSPAAMELVLNALIQTGGEGTQVDRYWDGKARPWCSLEITSINGEVKFFIWCFDNQKNFIMANLYASYPDIAVHEVEDYTIDVARTIDKWDMWACEYKLVKPDPYPIKTYVDYGLDKDPDEELKVDPLSAFIEILGSVKKEDQIWFQFIVRAHKAEVNVFNKKQPDKWADEAKAEIKKIIEETAVEDKEGNKTPNMTKLTEGKKDRIKALERSVGKPGFDVGIRAINLVPKGRGGFSIGILKGGFRPFGSNEHNGLAPIGTEFDYPWQDRKGKKVAYWKSLLFDAYRKRSYFHPPYTEFDIPTQKIMVLNTEELATLYHLPGSTVRTPALKRIPSKRADAPANLPI